MKLNRDNVVYIDLEQSEEEIKKICNDNYVNYDKLIDNISGRFLSKIWLYRADVNNLKMLSFIFKNVPEIRKELHEYAYIEKTLIMQANYQDIDNSDKDFLLSMIQPNIRKDDNLSLDTILDKISRFGINSLDKEEKENLESYSKK